MATLHMSPQDHDFLAKVKAKQMVAVLLLLPDLTEHTLNELPQTSLTTVGGCICYFPILHCVSLCPLFAAALLLVSLQLSALILTSAGIFPLPSCLSDIPLGTISSLLHSHY